MWDCISLFDNNAKKAIKDAGGVQAIAISHPHFLGACVEAAEYFDAPIYMSGKDKEWICRNSSRYFPFEGEPQALNRPELAQWFATFALKLE